MTPVTLVRNTGATLLFTSTDVDTGAVEDLDTVLPLEIKFNDWKTGVEYLARVDSDAEVVILTQSGATKGQCTLALTAAETLSFLSEIVDVSFFVTKGGVRKRSMAVKFAVNPEIQ